MLKVIFDVEGNRVKEMIFANCCIPKSRSKAMAFSFYTLLGKHSHIAILIDILSTGIKIQFEQTY